MKHLKIALLFAFVLASNLSLAKNFENYNYPYTDKCLATISTTLMSAKTSAITRVRQDLAVEILPNRDNIYLLEGRGKLNFEFYKNVDNSPLVFLLAGMGGSSGSGYLRQIAELLYNNGFHVIIIPSPFFWNFALSSSQTVLPGYAPDDARDIYNVMQKTLTYVKTNYSLKASEYSFVGFSLGGLEAAFVKKLDDEQKKINFSKVLLVNPPVSLLYSMQVLDRFSGFEKIYGEQQTNNLFSAALGILERLLPGNDRPDYFMNLEKKIPFSDEQLKLLIGTGMKESIDDIIYTTELVNNFGILKSPVTRYNRSLRLHEVQDYNFSQYFKEFLLPHIISQTLQAQNSFMELDKEVSMHAVAETITNSDNIYLMHNEDDLFINQDQLDFLKAIFGDRAYIYPYGGHLGNLWYEQNQLDLLHILKNK